ncbi:ATP-dependent DNA ligase [Meredithblackwellia eburnea MCA 4105]
MAKSSPSKKKQQSGNWEQSSLQSFFAKPRTIGAQPGGTAQEPETKRRKVEVLVISDDDEDGEILVMEKEKKKDSGSRVTGWSTKSNDSQTAPTSDNIAPVPMASSSKVKVEASLELNSPPQTDKKPLVNYFSNTSPSVQHPDPVPSVDLASSIFTFSLPSATSAESLWPDTKGRVSFSFLVQAWDTIASTKSRIIILRVLVNLLRVVKTFDPDSLAAIVWLTTNQLGPSFALDLEMGVGSRVLTNALKEACGTTESNLSKLYKKLGDPGDVAFEVAKNVRVLIRPPPMSCVGVFETFHKISKLKGVGSIDKKTKLVHKLLLATPGLGTKYLVRAIIQNLRIGAVKLTMTTALSRAFLLESNGEGTLTKREKEVMRALEVERERKTGGKSMGERGKRKPATNGKGRAMPKAKSEISESEDEEIDGLRDTGSGDAVPDEFVRASAEAKLSRAEQVVRKTWACHPDYERVVAGLLEGGVEDLDARVPLTIGTPLQPMLGHPTRSLASVYTRLSNRPFVSEAKLDGQRAQIHVTTSPPPDQLEGTRKGKGRWFDPKEFGGLGGFGVTNDQSVNNSVGRIWIRIFSKHLEDQTDKYPDLFPTLHSLISRTPTLTSFIVDAEICAIDPATSSIRTFQELSHRSKKDVEIGAVKVRVGVYAFDLMFLNGKSLLEKPFRERRELLHQNFGCLQPADVRWGRWDVMPSSEENDIEKVQAFFRTCLEMKAEGIMVKLLDEAEILSEDDEQDEDELEDDRLVVPTSPSKAGRKGNRKVLPSTYEPDKRIDSWLKVKKDYMDNVGDSLDLVPIGAWHGNGRKAAWWSPILLACWDEDNETFTAVSKCMSGFTDTFYKQLHERYPPGGERTSTMCYPGVDAAGLRPHIWFQPSEVWEIKAADFTLSPRYPAAQGLVSERGISLRFPRFIRLREDKAVEQATTSQELATLYEKQGDVDVGDKRESWENC